MAQRMQWGTFSGTGPELYQRFMVGAIFRPWAEDFLALAELRSDVRVLDVACGTGAVTRVVAGRVGGPGHVVGLDLSPGMLAVARASSEPGIEWREGNAMAMPFPDGYFDLVLCHQGLQFMPDRLAALREMRRVLVAGGRLVLGVFCSSPGNVALAHIGPLSQPPGSGHGLRAVRLLRSRGVALPGRGRWLQERGDQPRRSDGALSVAG